MSLNVLAIDDSRTMRVMLELALKEEGFNVHLAEDGQQGIDALNDFTPDVIVTDLNMPVMDGFGVIENVRRHGSLGYLPILVLTTESAPELKQRARQAGATGWIVKPFDKEKLSNAIRRVAA
jgi:two-component system chemotaxis response regulator CheY